MHSGASSFEALLARRKVDVSHLTPDSRERIQRMLLVRRERLQDEQRQQAAAAAASSAVVDFTPLSLDAPVYEDERAGRAGIVRLEQAAFTRVARAHEELLQALDSLRLSVMASGGDADGGAAEGDDLAIPSDPEFEAAKAKKVAQLTRELQRLRFIHEFGGGAVAWDAAGGQARGAALSPAGVRGPARHLTTAAATTPSIATSLLLNSPINHRNGAIEAALLGATAGSSPALSSVSTPAPSPFRGAAAATPPHHATALGFMPAEDTEFSRQQKTDAAARDLAIANELKMDRLTHLLQKVYTRTALPFATDPVGLRELSAAKKASLRQEQEHAAAERAAAAAASRQASTAALQTGGTPQSAFASSSHGGAAPVPGGRTAGGIYGAPTTHGLVGLVAPAGGVGHTSGPLMFGDDEGALMGLPSYDTLATRMQKAYAEHAAKHGIGNCIAPPQSQQPPSAAAGMFTGGAYRV